MQVSRNADNHPAFFAVYNMESTEIVAFYQVFIYIVTQDILFLQIYLKDLFNLAF